MLNSLKLNKQIALGGDQVVKDVGFSSAGINDNEAAEETERYPYQLRINLDEELLEMLGVDKLPALGASLDVIGKVKVVGLNEDEHGKGLCIQFTDMALGKPKEETPKENILYGG